MPLADKSRLRGVGLGENQVTDNEETRFLPGLHEHVHAVPAVETDRQAVIFQHPVHFPARRQHPVAVYVIRNGAPGPVIKADQVRRIGENEINAFVRKTAHNLYAVAVHES